MGIKSEPAAMVRAGDLIDLSTKASSKEAFTFPIM